MHDARTRLQISRSLGNRLISLTDEKGYRVVGDREINRHVPEEKMQIIFLEYIQTCLHPESKRTRTALNKVVPCGLSLEETTVIVHSGLGS